MTYNLQASELFRFKKLRITHLWLRQDWDHSIDYCWK